MKPVFSSWIRVAKPGADGWVPVQSRGIYILPSSHGFMYAIAVFLMLLGSLNYASNLGLLFTFLFVGLGIVAMLHTWRTLSHLSLRADSATPLFAGGEALFTLTLEAREHSLNRPMILLQKRGQESVASEFQLAADGSARVYLHLPAHHRGELPLGVLKLTNRYPLGLFKAWTFLESDARVLVYPKPAPGGLLHSVPDYVRSDQGDRGVGADDFVGPRPYRDGDPPRHLDWKAFARGRGLVTRQFGGDRAQQVWLDWQQAGGHDQEERLGRLCRMILEISDQTVCYGLRLPGIEVAPATGELHKHHCLSVLARYSPDTPEGQRK